MQFNITKRNGIKNREENNNKYYSNTMAEIKCFTVE